MDNNWASTYKHDERERALDALKKAKDKEKTTELHTLQMGGLKVSCSNKEKIEKYKQYYTKFYGKL